MKQLDQETYRIIAEAAHQATGGKIPNGHPAYLWVRENLAPLVQMEVKKETVEFFRFILLLLEREAT